MFFAPSDFFFSNDEYYWVLLLESIISLQRCYASFLNRTGHLVASDTCVYQSRAFQSLRLSFYSHLLLTLLSNSSLCIWKKLLWWIHKLWVKSSHSFHCIIHCMFSSFQHFPISQSLFLPSLSQNDTAQPLTIIIFLPHAQSNLCEKSSYGGWWEACSAW